MGIKVVKNKQHYGLYVWMMDNGKPFGDDHGNIMNIPGRVADIEKMSQIAQAARYYGAPSGEAKFLPGVNRVSESLYSEEMDRLKQGMIPSEFDIGAWQDAETGYKAARDRGENYDG